MNKFVALACAASALGITSTALGAGVTVPNNGGDDFSLTIQGTVPGFCTISSALSLEVGTGAGKFTPGKSALLEITSLGNSDGILQTMSATGSFQIKANESCKLSLVSANGGLANQSNPSAANISYQAVVWQANNTNSNSAPVTVPEKEKAFSGFNSAFDPVSLGNGVINFGFAIPSSGQVVAAGNYQDTLTVNVRPSI